MHRVLAAWAPASRSAAFLSNRTCAGTWQLCIGLLRHHTVFSGIAAINKFHTALLSSNIFIWHCCHQTFDVAFLSNRTYQQPGWGCSGTASEFIHGSAVEQSLISTSMLELTRESCAVHRITLALHYIVKHCITLWSTALHCEGFQQQTWISSTTRLYNTCFLCSGFSTPRWVVPTKD